MVSLTLVENEGTVSENPLNVIIFLEEMLKTAQEANQCSADVAKLSEKLDNEDNKSDKNFWVQLATQLGTSTCEAIAKLEQTRLEMFRGTTNQEQEVEVANLMMREILERTAALGTAIVEGVRSRTDELLQDLKSIQSTEVDVFGTLADVSKNLNAAAAGDLSADEIEAVKTLLLHEATKAFAKQFKLFNKKWLSVPRLVKEPLCLYNAKLPRTVSMSSQSVPGEVGLARLDNSVAVTDPLHEDTKVLFRLMGSLTTAQGLFRDQKGSETREGFAEALRKLVVEEKIPVPARLLSMLNGLLADDAQLDTASTGWV